MFLVLFFKIIQPIIVAIHKRYIFPSHTPEYPLNGCMNTPGRTWALCGRNYSISSSSSRVAACSSPTEATCVGSSNVSYYTFGKSAQAEQDLLFMTFV